MPKSCVLVYFAGIMAAWTAGVAGQGCICTMQWAPVCGQDGQTYGTACAANCKGVGIAYNGECTKGGGGIGGGDGGSSGGAWANPRATRPFNSLGGTWSSYRNPSYNTNNNNQWSDPGRWGTSWWPRKLLYSRAARYLPVA